MVTPLNSISLETLFVMKLLLYAHCQQAVSTCRFWGATYFLNA